MPQDSATARLPGTYVAPCIGFAVVGIADLERPCEITRVLGGAVNAACHQAVTAAQAAHADQLADALRYEPCSPTCANWLRYGVQPKNARPGLRPGCCKGKAHRREYLGYAGRRVLVSRKWSGKTLADHRADRKAWLTEVLGLPAIDPDRYTWELVTPGDTDHMPNTRRLLHIVADCMRLLAALDQARRRTAGTYSDLSATGRAA